MSIRQRLKKEIYQGKAKGKNVSHLEIRLASMTLTDEQKLTQKQSEYVRLYKIIEDSEFNPITMDEIMPLTNKLDEEIRVLRQSLHKEAWSMPYSIKKQINMKESNKGNEIEKILALEEPKEIKLLQTSDLVRYVVLLVDGIERRFNILTKQQFIDRNWFWFQYKRGPKTYTNCLRHKF